MQSAVFESILLNASHANLPRSQIPAFLYGCAWKKERTADLVAKALSSGFKGIDVAAQPRHYREDLAGEGVRKVIAEGICKREDLFIQTKFSPIGAQDPQSCPYDPASPIKTQVETSIASSLANLRPHSDSRSEDTYIDSVVMHSPLSTERQTLEAWSTLEAYVPKNIRNLGISNVTLPVLEILYKDAKIKPAVVQNRFWRDTEYDIPLRKFCRDKGIVYQSFWTLSANPQLLRHPSVLFLANKARVDPPVAMYSLVMSLEGVICLNGTQTHMVDDISGLDKIRVWADQNTYDWQNTVKHFKDATGDNNPGANPVEGALGHDTFGRDRNA